MPFSQRAAAFFDELVDDLRRVKLADLPRVAAAIRGTADATPARSPRSPSPSASSSSLKSLAASTLALDVGGSKLDALVDAVVLHAAEEAQGNQSAAARLLGIDRKTYSRRLARARARAKKRARSPSS